MGTHCGWGPINALEDEDDDEYEYEARRELCTTPIRPLVRRSINR